MLSLSASAVDPRSSLVTTHETKVIGALIRKKEKVRTGRNEQTLVCRGAGHWRHAREECVPRKGQRDRRQLR